MKRSYSKSVRGYGARAGISTAARLAYKAYKAYTNTKTRPAKRRKYIRSTRGSKSGRYARRPRRMSFRKRIMRAVPPQYLHVNVPSSVTSASATQNYTAPSRMLNFVAFSSMFTKSGLVPSDTKMFVLYIQYISREIMLRNQSNNQIVVYLYHCIARKDATTDIPTDAITQGFTQVNNGVVTAGQVLDPNVAMVSPYQSPDFTNRWRVVKTKKFIIDPGSVVQWKYFRPVNKFFYSSRLNDSVGAYGGLTDCLLIRHHGTPVNTIDGTTTTVSSSKLIMNIHEAYKYKILQQNQSVASLAQNFSTAPTQQLIAEDTDTVVQYTQA